MLRQDAMPYSDVCMENEEETSPDLTHNSHKKYQRLISAIEQQTLKVTIPRVCSDGGIITEDEMSSVVSSVHAGSCSRHQLCLQEKMSKKDVCSDKILLVSYFCACWSNNSGRKIHNQESPLCFMRVIFLGRLQQAILWALWLV